MTIAELEKAFITELNSLYSEHEAKALVFYVLHYLNGINRSSFLLSKHETIENETAKLLPGILEQLKAGKPVQYIFGKTEFYGLPLKVNPSVLIPRPETEELVDWVIKEVVRRETEDGSKDSEIPIPKSEMHSILDIGTGSGCIAIALKKHLPEAEVYGLDISSGALETAGQNAVLNHTEIELLQEDILKPDLIFKTRFSIIVSNPPYISSREQQQMHINVIDYEPHEALFVPDNDPLIFYEHIADFASHNLVSEGLLFFEIHESLGKQVISLLVKKGFSDLELRKDMQGKDRMVKAKLS
jgi:release factor glutamine methyltransferase